MTSLSLGNKKKLQGTDLESRVVTPVRQCFFWQKSSEFPRHYELENCHGEPALTSFPTALFSLTERIRRRKKFLQTC